MAETVNNQSESKGPDLMRVFITGGSGWIGSAVVDELLSAGHQLVGLARSPESATALELKNVEVLSGDLDDPGTLRRGVLDAEAVVHLANKHNWADPSVSNRAERAAVQTIAEALVGSDHPFVLASGVPGMVAGRPGAETDRSPFSGPDAPRGGSENLALDYVGRGVRTISVRFAATVHGVGDPQFIALIAAAARKHGVSGYVGDGSAAWPAVHRTDAATLVRLALERAPAGSRLHAVAEPAVSTRAIAEAIGRVYGVPVTSIDPRDAVEHFGFVGGFFGMNLHTTSDQTRALLDWTPTGPTLINDIEAGAYGR